MFRFLCIYVLISMLWCLLRFPHTNDVRFVFTPSCAHVLFVVFVFVCKLFKVKIGVTQTPISNRKWTQVFLIRRHCDFHHTIILAFFFFLFYHEFSRAINVYSPIYLYPKKFVFFWIKKPNTKDKQSLFLIRHHCIFHHNIMKHSYFNLLKLYHEFTCTPRNSSE